MSNNGGQMIQSAKQEEYVQQRWSTVQVLKSGEPAISWINDDKAIRVRFGDWQAAYAFTLQREREIAEVEEEIVWLKGVMILTTPNEGSTIGIRTLTRLQAIRAELTKGWKG